MEEGLNSRIKEYFDLKNVDIRTYSPLSLAYIGDSIFDIIIRTVVVDGGNTSVKKLHNASVKYVSAKSQDIMAKGLMEEFNEKEKEIFRKGKNTKMNSVAKNASLKEYRNATGFEAVLGYLYLEDDIDRIMYLVKRGIEIKNERSK